MGEQLTIGQTAKRLGLEVDTVRKLERAGQIRAIRTKGGHRRFTEEEIDRFRKSRRKGASARSGPVRPRSAPRRPPRPRSAQGRHPRTGEFLPLGVEVADDFDDLDEGLPLDEFEEDIEAETYALQPTTTPPLRPAQVPQAPAPRPALFEPRPAPVARAPVIPAPATLTGFANQLRLQTIKGYGRAAIPWNVPPEWQGKVIADMERYVTAIQFPADLSYAKAAGIVRARVAEVLRPYHETEEKVALQKKAKEEADRHRAALIAHGNDYARRETGDWDWSASHGARDEVKKVLEREVEHDWTEHEVEDTVDQVLDEWDDEDGEEWDDD